jgi:hypothetical protein
LTTEVVKIGPNSGVDAGGEGPRLSAGRDHSGQNGGQNGGQMVVKTVIKMVVQMVVTWW